MSIYNKLLVFDLVTIAVIALLSLFTPFLDAMPFLEKSLYVVLSVGGILLLSMDNLKHKNPYDDSYANNQWETEKLNYSNRSQS